MPHIHTVKQGECLTTISQKYGFGNPSTIYDHADNAELRKKRPNKDILAPGDKVVIPDKSVKSVPTQTDEAMNLTIQNSKRVIRMKLLDESMSPLAGEKYELGVIGGVIKGTTDGSGILEEELPTKVFSGLLYIPRNNLMLSLSIGTLDPTRNVETGEPVVAGVQARLNNMGFNAGKVDSKLGPKTEAAIIAFQKKVMKIKTPIGKLDTKTIDTLESQHGC